MNNNENEEFTDDKSSDIHSELPNWMKDKQNIVSGDSRTKDEKISKSEISSIENNESSDSGWQKEVEAIVSGSTKPNPLDGGQFVKHAEIIDSQQEGKLIHDDNKLPEWLDLVIETEEEKNTTQLNLKSGNIEATIQKDSELIQSSKQGVVLSIDNDNESTSSVLEPNTRPLFIDILKGDQSSHVDYSEDFKLDLIQNLLQKAEIAKVLSLGQELIKDQNCVEELTELLSIWLIDNPNSVNVLQLLGDAYMHLNRPTKALKAYSEATRLLSSR